MKVAIVTDSTADIPAGLVASNHIEIVPNLIIMDGKSLIDNEEISRNEFYERMPHMKSLPTTATASTGAYQDLYDRLFKQGFETILSIHASQLLSGIFNAASGAAQAFGDRVHVIDSGQVTMSLGWQVLAAAEAAARGLPSEDILQQVSDVHRRVRLIAMLDTLEYVKRSGRISWARASLGGLLQIKPFIEVREGHSTPDGRSTHPSKSPGTLACHAACLGSIRKISRLAYQCGKGRPEFINPGKANNRLSASGN